MPGKLVISLDFELMWGVRDKRDVADYGDAVLNVRKVVPEILDRFASFGIRATWATVGLLFCRTRDEMHDLAPKLRPEYSHLRLSPYAALLNEVGRNETEDPYYFGRSLIDRVIETEGQEIATHTFSHFCCLEAGHSLEAFEADLDAAKTIAGDARLTLQSIVFPRNQFSNEHIQICRKSGLISYRGNPDGFAYQARTGDDTKLAMRGFRLADAVFPISRRSSYALQLDGPKIANVKASRFLRPFMSRTPALSKLHVDRILREMRAAARLNEVYHLWWHPHNMGRSMRSNLSQLDSILEEYRRLKDSNGFGSSNMYDMSSQKRDS